ncbi:hypothetical protein ASZ78_009496 [Callipepla squamata]|uniref:Prolyl 4-hydroxylase alpha subunit domain-containing protein n=1 Tax=Callipepla squamata TaxID=9009 RepID=A0A226MRX6_CALSU|nr:hypothetical protein ASZ78_009496 [Callipepla squamata]
MGAKRRGAAGGRGGEKRGRRDVAAELCAALGDAALRERAAAAWAGGEPLRHEAVAVERAPFRHGVLRGLLASPAFAAALSDELLCLGFRERRNDLLSLRQALSGALRVWLEAVTHIELEHSIDISCVKYESTDVLLCHDDELEGRRIAFILYLVPPWEKSDGGTLDLFSTDGSSRSYSLHVTYSKLTCCLMFQVSEILSEEKCRLSVSGWFHGPAIERPARYVEAPLPRSPHIPYDCSNAFPFQHEILYEWVNLVYLDMDSQAQIQEEFEERSEILLKDFLKKEKFQLLCKALENEDIRWSSRGPPNKRLYETAEEDSVPDILKNFLQFLRSEALFLLLSNFTGLKLHFLAPSDEDEGAGEGRAADSAGNSSSKSEEEETEQHADSSTHQPDQPDNISEAQDSETQNGSSTPMCAGELRRWTNGHYTLVHDNQATEFALDLLFYCGCEDWDPEYGGFTSYIAKGEDEEVRSLAANGNLDKNCLGMITLYHSANTVSH